MKLQTLKKLQILKQRIWNSEFGILVVFLCAMPLLAQTSLTKLDPSQISTTGASSGEYLCNVSGLVGFCSGLGTGSPNTATSFSATTSVAIPGKGTPNVLVACYNNASPSIQIPFSSLEVSQTSPYDVTVAFSSAQSGYCAVNAAGSGFTGNASIDALGNIGGNSFTTNPSGNGCAVLPGTGGNSVSICGTASQQGGTLNPSAFLNAGTVTIPAVLTVQTSSTDQISAAAAGTAETAFATSYNIPSSFFLAGRTIRATYTFELSTSSSPATQRLRLRLGGLNGTVIYDSGAFAPGASLTTRSASFVCTITGTAAVGASAAVYTGCLGPGDPTTPWTASNTIVPNATIATNATQALTATMTYGAATAGNTSNLWSMIVEDLN
jgi:hypothetical protein